jgi:hypothetical protein
MTDTREVTLAELLADASGAPKIDSAVFESSQSVGDAWERVRGVHAVVTRRGVASAALDGMTKLFSTPITSLFAGAWNAHRALAPYGDSKLHPPEETNLVPLAQHTITSSYKPHVDVLIAGELVETIEFELELSLEIEAAVLKIQGAKIREIEVGSCKGRGKLVCAGATLLEKETHEIRSPGVLRFERGIAIQSGGGG